MGMWGVLCLALCVREGGVAGRRVWTPMRTPDAGLRLLAANGAEFYVCLFSNVSLLLFPVSVGWFLDHVLDRLCMSDQLCMSD